MKKIRILAVVFICLFTANTTFAGDGKLIATAGLIQVEGAGGGGLVPWATLPGYDSRDEYSVNAFSSYVTVDDYKLHALGASVSLYDRVELSVAQQSFSIKAGAGDIEQTIVGAKVRLYGDVIFSRWPQVSLGVLHKSLKDDAIALALGAQDTSGTDVYIAATKVHLGAVSGYNLVWNATVRYTNANQMGLLGFGSVNDDSHELMLECTVGVLFNRHLAVGGEFRQKPDNIALPEEDWKAAFVTYIPNKNFNITVAYAMLGSIAGADDQNGLYVSIGGTL